MATNKYKMEKIKASFNKGSGLVEILVAIFIFTAVLGSLIAFSNMYLSGAGESLNSTKGAYLAEEGIEAVKIMRDAGWSNISALSANTNYYFYFDTTSSVWKATTTPSSVDSIFVRTFQLSSVYRDSNGRIISSGGTLDTNTEEVVVSVSWQSKTATTTKTLSAYITNII